MKQKKKVHIACTITAIKVQIRDNMKVLIIKQMFLKVE